MRVLRKRKDAELGRIRSMSTWFWIVLVVLLAAVEAQFQNDPCKPGGPPVPVGVICPNSQIGPQSGVGNTGGVIATSSYATCAAYSSQDGGGLSCSSDDQLTTLDLQLTPGSGQTISYDFNVIKQPPADGSVTTDNPGSSGSCKGGGNCVVTDKIRLTVEVSESVVYYDLVPVGLRVPYQYTPHHSNAFRASKDTGKNCQAIALNGFTSAYENQGLLVDGKYRYKEGIEFTGMVAPPIVPNTAIVNFAPYTWELDATYQLDAAGCVQPFGDKNQIANGAANCNPIINGNQCNAVNPTNAPSFNYGMVPVAPDMRPFARGLVLPRSPYSDYNVFGFSKTIVNQHVLPLMSAFVYEISEDPDALWTSCNRMHSGGRLSNRSPQQMWAGNYFYYGPVETAQYYYRWESGLGLKQDAQFIDRPTSVFMGDVRPVCIGCGYDWMFPSTTMLTPVPARDGGVWQPGDPCPYRRCGNMTEDRIEIPCTGDDANCLGAGSSIISESLTSQPAGSSSNNNLPNVAVAVCRGLDPPNRLGQGTALADAFIPGLGQLVKVCDAAINGAISYANGIYLGGDTSAQPPQGFIIDGTFFCSSDRTGAWEIDTFAITQWLADSVTNSLGPVLGSFVSLVFYNALEWANIVGSATGVTERDRYTTADTMGVLGPNMCQVMQIRQSARPLYAMRAKTTPIDAPNTILDQAEITNNPQQYQCHSDANTQDDVSQTNVVGSNGTMYLKLIGFETHTGKIGPDLIGYIVVCNVTDHNVGIYQTDQDTRFPSMPVNPWTTNTCDGVNPSPRCKFMEYKLCNAAVGKPPLSQCLAARPPECKNGGYDPYNPYAMWYYVPPRNVRMYGEGCGQLGIQNSRWSEPGFAQDICTRGRYACVPGAIESYDWSLEDRLNDQLNTTQVITSTLGITYIGRNAREKSLRDSLPVKSPCVITGYYRELLDAKTPQEFLTLSNLQGGWLPPNYALYDGSDKLGLPNFAVDGFRLYNFGQANSNTQSAIRAQVGVAGTISSVQTTVSSGAFVKRDQTTCGVQLGASGRVQLHVENTGTLTGSYRITSQCTNGVRQPGPMDITVMPGGILPVQVTLKQSGASTNGQPAVCQFNLSSPSLPQIGLFDLFRDVTCRISFVSNSANVSFEGVSILTCTNTSNSSTCVTRDLADYTVPPDHSLSYGIALWTAFLVFVVVGVGFGLALLLLSFKGGN